jgi:MFS family permease
MAEFTIMTPSIQAFAMHFHDTDMTTIMLANTITGVVGVPMSILAGWLVNKIGYRPMGIIGAIVMIVAGAFPFLFPGLQEYWPIIFSRVMVGVGYGMIFPLGGALIILFYKGRQRSRYLGVGVMVQFAFAILFSLVAGWLTTIGWNFSFLTYLISVVPLVLLIFLLPEGKKLSIEDAKAKAALKANAPKAKIPGATWGYIVVFGLVMWMMYIVVNFLSSIILGERGIGDAAAAGVMASCFNLGNVVAGLLFSKSIQLLKSKVFGVAGLVAAIGLACAYIAPSVLVYGIAAFLIGLGGSTVYTSAQNSVGNITPKAKVPLTNGLLTAAMNLASFFVAYWLVLCTGIAPVFGGAAALVVGAICVAVVSVVCIFIPFKAIRKGLGKQPTDALDEAEEGLDVMGEASQDQVAELA